MSRSNAFASMSNQQLFELPNQLCIDIGDPTNNIIELPYLTEDNLWNFFDTQVRELENKEFNILSLIKPQIKSQMYINILDASSQAEPSSIFPVAATEEAGA